MLRYAFKQNLVLQRVVAFSTTANVHNSKLTIPEHNKTVDIEDVRKFVFRCLKAVKVRDEHAKIIGSNLFAADYRGHFSHGLQRLEMYVREVQKGVTSTTNEPRIVKETLSTALVDGGNVLGAVAGVYSMNLAIKKGKESGVAFVATRNSNHYGIAGYYALMALEHGLIGLSMTDTSPLVQITRSKTAGVGTNPIAVAAPGSKKAGSSKRADATGIAAEFPHSSIEHADDYVLDMATSAAAVGKIEMAKRKGVQMPPGWGADKDGEPTLDPAASYPDGYLLPLGGVEATGGYKGYGLGMLVEVLCGVLAGANYGTQIRKWMRMDKPANLGQCFMVIDPARFGEGFEDRMSDFAHRCRSLPLRDPKLPVLIPGDPERLHMEFCDEMRAIPYHNNVLKALDALADSLQVAQITRKEVKSK